MAAAGAGKVERDYRVDFFRGLALLFIFIDHIPENLFAYITLRNFGFCDAAEVFIFLSGYSAGLVFTMRQDRRGFAFASFEMLRRVWTLYVVHIFVFMLFTAQVSFTAARFGNPIYFEEMMMGEFLQEPHVAVVEALLLRFQPRFLDILPLYIVLLLFLPVLMAIPRRFSWVCLAASATLYLLTHWFDWSLRAYPDEREWTFNPLAWQFLFCIGAMLGRHAAGGRQTLPRNRWVIGGMLAFLGFALVVGLSWTIAGVYPAFPAVLETALWPLDKTNLSPWRLAHFLALAYIIVVMTRPDQPFFRSAFARPLVLSGQYGLDLFCLGIFLSLFGHIITSEISNSLVTQIVVNVGGCGLMIGLALMLNWYKKLSKGPADAGGGRGPVGKPA